MKSILNAISNQIRRKTEAAASDAQRFKQLIAQAATKGGDLPEKEADELLAVSERLGHTTEVLEAKVAEAIEARTAFDTILPQMRKLAEAVKRAGAAEAARDAAKAHFEKVANEAKAKYEAAAEASKKAFDEVSRIEAMALTLRELYERAADVLPEPTEEINYLRSTHFSFGWKPDPGTDYSQPKAWASKVVSVPHPVYTPTRQGIPIQDTSNQTSVTING